MSNSVSTGSASFRGGALTSSLDINGDTFAPPPSYMAAALTPKQAWDKWTHRSGPVRPKVGYRLGILTSPPSITDVLVWGFSYGPVGCLRSLPVGDTSPPSPDPCIEWTFVNAKTGRMVEGTFQQIGAQPPHPKPPSQPQAALRSGGFLDATEQRFSPQDLVLQSPLSTIRWTFDNPTCTVRLHWFLPPANQSSPTRSPCPWQHRFTTTITTNFTSRGHVFTVLAGYVPEREHYLVKATLANGTTQIYDASGADAAWMIAVQRCPDPASTAVTTIRLVRFGRGATQTEQLSQRLSSVQVLARECRPTS
jgi:hypothetical protein